MNELIFLVEESVDGGYEAKAIGESIFTQGEDLEDLKVQIKEAINCHFEENNMPKMVRLHFVKDEVFAI
ncbi:MAG: 2-oxoisovalerate dehydrogenase [Bacteroidia bacterium]|jgi:predicted RNase H-like HicB family nuclease